MARTNRTAFTLVEMLVVIVIISMLVALLVPAVIGARERARRVQCMNRMDQLGKGIIQYESSKGHLPGYVNQFGAGTLRASSVTSRNNLSWVVVILENIGRADLWKEWRSGTGPAADRVVALSEVVCPSDTNKRGQEGVLSFAANCGISDVAADVAEYKTLVPDAYDDSAWGLFFDHDSSDGLPGTRPVNIGLDEIADGAQQTMLLSENLDATSWSDATPFRQTDVGFVWWSAAPSLTWSGDVPSMVTVNAQGSPKYRARPSSNHPGGVNAVFADGHSDFISDRVEYTVFRDQMISNQSVVKKAGLLIP